MKKLTNNAKRLFMPKSSIPTTQTIKVLFVAAMLACSMEANGAAFQSYEQSATLLGGADAGTAVTSDPSIQFYNPAGMAFIKHTELGISSEGIRTNTNMTVSKSTNILGKPVAGTTTPPETSSILPAFFFIHPVTDKLTFGFGVEVPFGLETDYPLDSKVRYFATDSKIETINLNPSMAIKINDKLAVGMGFDATYSKIRLNREIDGRGLLSPAILQLPYLKNMGDILLQNKADGWDYGWNAGIYLIPCQSTHIGLAYHSAMDPHLSGTSQISGIPSNAVAINIVKDTVGLENGVGTVSSNLALPAYITLSISHEITPRWTVMADVENIRWSTLQNIKLKYGGTNSKFLNATTPVLPFRYRNTWHLALGQSYQAAKDLVLRMGIAFDESPIPNQFRNPLLPSKNRYWVALGGTYTINKHASVSIGYAHIFVQHNTVNNSLPTPLGTQTLIAHYSGGADIVGVQLNIRFS